MSDSNRSTDNSPTVPSAKKTYAAPTLTECGTVAKLTMAKGTTNVELGQVVRKACL